MEDIHDARWTEREDHLYISPSLRLTSGTIFVIANVLRIRTPGMINHMLGHLRSYSVLSNVADIPVWL